LLQKRRGRADLKFDILRAEIDREGFQVCVVPCRKVCPLASRHEGTSSTGHVNGTRSPRKEQCADVRSLTGVDQERRQLRLEPKSLTTRHRQVEVIKDQLNNMVLRQRSFDTLKQVLSRSLL